MVFKNSGKILHRVSHIFQPTSVVPKNAQIKRHDITSKSQKLMLDLGIIRQASPGCFHFLPLGLRSLEKLIAIVDDEMKQIGGQKVMFPTLTNVKLWETTGRLADVSSELFTLTDRHNQNYILSPTHEEAVSDLVASIGPVSYKQFPLKLYQITSKYRDEMKPRFGLMRGKQFIMKDMYSFDVDLERARETYETICNSYNSIFSKIGVNFVKVLGSTGHIGGSISHEYHYKAKVGEDKILTCNKCQYSANTEVSGDEKCPKCESTDVEISSGIEVGHTFLLEDKYSKPLKATYLAKDAKPKFLQMGCYGLGLSRILAAAIELLSTEQEARWPFAFAPYYVIILPPKRGSKEESQLENSNIVERLYDQLELTHRLKDNVLVDDRTSFTIGRRFLEAKKMGYPYIVALGNKSIADPPLYELTDLRSNQQLYLSESDLISYITKNVV